jgi:hypothetical protein
LCIYAGAFVLCGDWSLEQKSIDFKIYLKIYLKKGLKRKKKKKRKASLSLSLVFGPIGHPSLPLSIPHGPSRLAGPLLLFLSRAAFLLFFLG